MKGIERFNKELCAMSYGWYDRKGKLHLGLKDGDFVKEYRMQYPDEVKKHKNGVCWDLCELEREYFKKRDIPFMTVFAVNKYMKNKPNHTFTIFKKNGKVYWFEASWDLMKGVREYNTIEELFADFRKNFTYFVKGKPYVLEDVVFYRYKKPVSRISCNVFYIYCMFFGKKIRKDKKRLYS